MLSEAPRNYKRHNNHDKLKLNFKGKISLNLFLTQRVASLRLSIRPKLKFKYRVNDEEPINYFTGSRESVFSMQKFQEKWKKSVSSAVRMLLESLILHQLEHIFHHPIFLKIFLWAYKKLNPFPLNVSL